MAKEKWGKKPPVTEEKLPWQQSLVLYLHDLTAVLAWIMVIFVLLFRMVVVDGSSMYNTLIHKDWVLLLSNVFYTEPEYGDIVVATKESFRDGEPIIKRVIATEGQKVDIDFEAGIVYVDDVALQEDYTYTLTTNPEGVMFPLIVDENCLFVMGDNREGSMDSRDPQIGLIDRREILGKALMILFPGDGKFGGERDFSRIGVLN